MKKRNNLETTITNIPSKKKSPLARIAESYFSPKRFEKNGTIYKMLGVKYFQKILMGTIGKAFRAVKMDSYPSNYFITKKKTLANINTYESWTRFNEAIHAPFAIWYIHNTLQSIGKRKPLAALGNIATAIIHFYCTILQRYNRERVYKVIEHLENKKNKPTIDDRVYNNAA